MDVLKISPKLKQFVIVLFLLGPAAWLATAANGPKLLRVAMTADAMGSTYSVELYGYNRVKLTEAANAALDETRRLDGVLLNCWPESEWSHMNQLAAETVLPISPEFFVNCRQWAARRKPKDFRVYFCADRTDQPCAWLQ